MSLGLLESLCPLVPEGFFATAGCFVAEWEIPILLLVIGGIAGIWWWLRQVGWEDDSSLLILPMGGSTGAAGGGGALAWESDEEYQKQRADLKRALSSIDPLFADRDDRRVPLVPTREDRRSEPDPTERVVLPPAGARPPEGGNSGSGLEPRSGTGYRRRSSDVADFEPEPQGTLQLLPGRLEVVSGPGSGEEMRFVRVPGAKQEVTLGRLEGPPFQHLQLKSQTVSRNHARLMYRDGIWILRNESGTNPTLHNGRPLSSILEEVPLHDGDQIEVGEVALVFHGGTAPPGGLPQRSSWYTDRGRRSVNQDAVVVRTLSDGRDLAAVCDGMGSHAEGGVASHIALESMVAALSGGSRLQEAVERANEAVLAAAAEDPEREGMATTLVAMLREGAHYEIANIGDSRAYRITDEEIQQVTRDHSFVAEAVEAGRMSKEDAEQSPWKTAVTRSLGAEAHVEVDVFQGFEAADPAIILLCTDGVHGVLESDDIMDLVRRTSDIRDLARTIAEEALLRGGEDNVAAAVVRVGVKVGTGAQDG